MIEKEKTNSELGLKVREHLTKKGLMNLEDPNDLTHQQKLDELTILFDKMIHILGLNIKDGNLEETPKRLAKLYLNDLFYGLDWNNFPKCTAINKQFIGYDNFVLLKDIR